MIRIRGPLSLYFLIRHVHGYGGRILFGYEGKVINNTIFFTAMGNISKMLLHHVSLSIEAMVSLGTNAYFVGGKQ
jgi:hypothetical protein